jgi:hypothetical protein
MTSIHNIPNTGQKVNILDTALYYAGLNLPVLLLQPRGKKPLTANGLHDATTDTAIIKDWWNRQPNANIGIRCNGLLVIDVDGAEGKKSIAAIEAAYDKLPHTWTVQTGRGGNHIIYKVPESLNIRPGAGKYGYPNIDIRANDSYIVAAGSFTENEYKTIYGTPEEITAAPEWLIDFVLSAQPNEHKPAAPVPDKIPEGQRNATLTSIAGTMQRRGMTPDAIEAALIVENEKRCNPPLGRDEIKNIVTSVSRYQPEPEKSTKNNDKDYNVSNIRREFNDADTKRDNSRDKNVTNGSTSGVKRDKPLAALIRDFIESSTGYISFDEVDRELDIRADERDARRQAISRLLKDKVIEKHRSQNKLFRYINPEAPIINFKNHIAREALNIRFPVGIHNLVKVYPKNIIVVAGAPDAGKTSFVLNIIKLNHHNFDIHYFNSEMGEDEFTIRLQNFEGMAVDDWNFNAYSRSDKFHDVIIPNAFNIVDFMEVFDNFYEIGERIAAIHDKLSTGICIVCVQMNHGADAGRGGSFGLEKPRLYLTLDEGVMSIRKAKNWRNPALNPNRLKLNYKIVGGGSKFLIDTYWHKEEEPPIPEFKDEFQDEFI